MINKDKETARIAGAAYSQMRNTPQRLIKMEQVCTDN